MEIKDKGLAIDIDEVLSQTALYWMDIMQKKVWQSRKTFPR